MRFLAALLFWLVTTVALAAAVPATWAQHNVVERGRLRGAGRGGGQGSAGCRRRWPRELTDADHRAGRRQRLRRSTTPSSLRGVAAAYTAQPGFPGPVRAGQPHRAPVDVHRLRSAATRAPATAGSSTSHRCSPTTRCGRRSATSTSMFRRPLTVPITVPESPVAAARPAAPVVDVGPVGEHRRLRAHRGVRAADTGGGALARQSACRAGCFGAAGRCGGLGRG